MKIFIDNKQEIEFSEQELDEMYFNEGEEGIIYQYGEYAYKIYKRYCRKYRLTEEDCEKMIEIPTKNVLLPRGMIYDKNHQFIGYYTNFIERQPIPKILSLSLKDFVMKVGEVTDDLSLLAKNEILVEDMILQNFCYEDGFYFVDPGSYTFLDSFSKIILESFNREEFIKFLVKEIFARSLKISRPEERKLEKYFLELTDMSEILISEDENQSVKKYLKRKTLFNEE